MALSSGHSYKIAWFAGMLKGSNLGFSFVGVSVLLSANLTSATQVEFLSQYFIFRFENVVKELDAYCLKLNWASKNKTSLASSAVLLMTFT